MYPFSFSPKCAVPSLVTKNYLVERSYKAKIIEAIENEQQKFLIHTNGLNAAFNPNIYIEKSKALIKVINALEEIHHFREEAESCAEAFVASRHSNLINDIQLVIRHQRAFFKEAPEFDVSKKSIVDDINDPQGHKEKTPATIDDELPRLDIYQLYLILIYDECITHNEFIALIQQLPNNQQNERFIFESMLKHIEEDLSAQYSLSWKPYIVKSLSFSGALNYKHFKDKKPEFSPTLSATEQLRQKHRLWWGRLLTKLDIIIMDTLRIENNNSNILKACSPLNNFMILLIQELIAYKPELFQPEPLQPNQARGLFKTYNLFLYAYHLYLDGWQEFGVFNYEDFLAAIGDARSVQSCQITQAYYETIKKIVENSLGLDKITAYMTTHVDQWYMMGGDRGKRMLHYQDMPPFISINNGALYSIKSDAIFDKADSQKAKAYKERALDLLGLVNETEFTPQTRCLLGFASEKNEQDQEIVASLGFTSFKEYEEKNLHRSRYPSIGLYKEYNLGLLGYADILAYNQRKVVFFNSEKVHFKCLCYAFVLGDEISFMAIFQAWLNLLNKGAIFKAQPPPGTNKDFYDKCFAAAFLPEEKTAFLNLLHQPSYQLSLQARKQRFVSVEYFFKIFTEQFMFVPLRTGFIVAGQVSGQAKYLKETTIWQNQAMIEASSIWLEQMKKKILTESAGTIDVYVDQKEQISAEKKKLIANGKFKMSTIPFLENTPNLLFLKHAGFLKYREFANFFETILTQNA